MAIAVVIPGQFGEHRHVAPTYARRRLTALLTVVATALVLLLGAGHVVANRGGAPASAPAIRPATAAATASAAPAVYVVRSGDTLWSIGQRFHGQISLSDYVDALIDLNGGTRLQVSQAITLP
jgi:Tfp pilus assembly protein FimV